MQVLELFVLLSDDLFVLKFEQLTFLLEVSHDLPKASLEQVYLGLEQFDFFVFFKLLLRVLLHRLALLPQVIRRLLVV